MLTKTIMMASPIRFLLVVLLLPFASIAQIEFKAVAIDRSDVKSLSGAFSNYSVFQINTKEIRQYAVNKHSNISFNLLLPGLDKWSINITEADILDKGYTLTVVGPSGKTTFPKPDCITYAGNINNQSGTTVRLTITDELIYGIIRSTSSEYFIEPLRYFDRNAPADLFVVYNVRDVIYDPAISCGYKEMSRFQKNTESGSRIGVCAETQIVIASDESMFIKYGSVAAVQAHNIGVMNNVQVDYTDNQFAYDIVYNLMAQNISITSGTDQILPAYTGTNSSTILSGFRAWGNAGNFGVTYDIAQMWTNRNIDADGAGGNSGIVGLAYVGVVCGTSRYHLLQDYTGTVPTGSGYQLRVLTSHEIGHNFDADHDATGSGFIMAPSINNTTVWSPASVSSVNAHVTSRTCLGDCISAGDCATITRLHHSTATLNAVTLSWDAVPGNLTYDVEYKPASSSTWVSAASSISATNYNLNSGLQQATLYDWRVRPYCSSGQGTFVSSQFATSTSVISCASCANP